MRHVSMMPPTDEPAYRRRHEARKIYWSHMALFRAHREMWDQAQTKIDVLDRQWEMLRSPTVN